MKSKYLKMTGIVLLVAAVCTIVYAERQETLKLPDAVVEAVDQIAPDAVIEEAEFEEVELDIYEVELAGGIEVMVAPDGVVVAVETADTLENLPQAVADAIKALAGDASVEEIEKKVTYAEVQIVELETPVTTYEAEFVKDGREIEVELSADGKVLSLEEEGDDDDDHDGDYADD